MREVAFKKKKKRKIYALALMKKRPNLSGNWIEAQVNIKEKFHLNSLTVEDLDTMLLSVLIRKQRIRLKNQRKPYQRIDIKGRDSIEILSMLNKIAVHLKTQMNPQVRKEPLNSC